jgi:hypothetical protein
MRDARDIPGPENTERGQCTQSQTQSELSRQVVVACMEVAVVVCDYHETAVHMCACGYVCMYTLCSHVVRGIVLYRSTYLCTWKRSVHTLHQVMLQRSHIVDCAAFIIWPCCLASFQLFTMLDGRIVVSYLSRHGPEHRPQLPPGPYQRTASTSWPLQPGSRLMPV